jgi:hypothetical protein
MLRFTKQKFFNLRVFSTSGEVDKFARFAQFAKLSFFQSPVFIIYRQRSVPLVT